MIAVYLWLRSRSLPERIKTNKVVSGYKIAATDIRFVCVCIHVNNETIVQKYWLGGSELCLNAMKPVGNVCVCLFIQLSSFTFTLTATKFPLPKSGTEALYLGEQLGDALGRGLAEICVQRPTDPIEYLALWLKRYSDNMRREKEVSDAQK